MNQKNLFVGRWYADPALGRGMRFRLILDEGEHLTEDDAQAERMSVRYRAVDRWYPRYRRSRMPAPASGFIDRGERVCVKVGFAAWAGRAATAKESAELWALIGQRR